MILTMDKEFSFFQTIRDMKDKCVMGKDQDKELSFTMMEEFIGVLGKMMKNLDME